MLGSPKVFFASSASRRSGSLRRLLSTSAFSAACLLFGLTGFLAASLALSRSPSVTHSRCPDSSRPLSVSIAWDRSPGDGSAAGSAELPASLATGSRGRHKVDGDTSTNDCVIAMASGLSGLSGIQSLDSIEAQQFQACLDAVMQSLAKSIAWDGEGATCLIEVTVSGANNEAEAAKIARSVASSSLVKAAIFGRDPNWGRIACSVGYSGIQFDANRLDISLGVIPLMKNGQPLPFDRLAASKYLKDAGDAHGTVNIDISVGSGGGNGKAWGCDLSYKYVEINAEYTT
ncbi:Arginine biosynthesis bifunctional protein ArgJ, chloroplastic [Zea mays]|uniref:Arginine biosynthesis bifunctional protein ArgJ, chloroplastic n=1 Tax=Zea mays TaxID=4577 RepID=A0A317Y2D0_MAIZE|nr:Arginine biosynthesis bifunctional protein ArgJ, chloroplastic [Zea mays]